MQKALVKIAKGMTVFTGIKINLIKLVYNLADNRTIFHIVVGTGKDITHVLKEHGG